MGLLHSRQNASSPETVSYHRRGACAAGCDNNGSVIVDALPGSAPANDVIVAVVAGAPTQVR